MLNLKYLSYSFFIIAIVSLCACSENEEEIPSDNLSTKMNIQLKVSDTFSAFGNGSQLPPDGEVTEPDANLNGTQHACDVKLYVFAGNDEQAYYTGSRLSVGWEKYFLEHHGKLPEHTAQMSFSFSLPGGSTTGYTLLGVALNRSAAEAFDIDFKEYTPLKEVGMRLKEISSSIKIRQSEIYVGTLKIASGDNFKENPRTLVMHRRVAGVMGWFKNVPEALPDPETRARTKVKAVRISLFDNQNTALYLIRQPQKPRFYDFIQSPTTDPNGQVLVDIERTSATLNGGAFVLPAAAPVLGNYTLRVELVDISGKVLKSYRARLPKDDELDHGQTGGGTGIIDTGSAFRFPIVANHFYAIGTSGTPQDLENPNGDILITLDPSWEEEVDLDVTEKTVSKP